MSNILLTDLDRELERRGQCFRRYADDCNVYVPSFRAGEHLMTELTAFLEGKLRLKVNREKSAVARPWDRKFLGYSFTRHKQPRVKIAPSSLERLKARVRELMRIGRGRNIVTTIDVLAPVLRGWMSYYRLTEARGVLQELDGWIRRELRRILWRQWKRPLTRIRMLQKQGLSENRARGSALKPYVRWCERTAGVSPPPARCTPGRTYSGCAVSIGVRVHKPLTAPARMPAIDMVALSWPLGRSI